MLHLPFDLSIDFEVRQEKEAKFQVARQQQEMNQVSTSPISPRRETSSSEASPQEIYNKCTCTSTSLSLSLSFSLSFSLFTFSLSLSLFTCLSTLYIFTTQSLTLCLIASALYLEITSLCAMLECWLVCCYDIVLKFHCSNCVFREESLLSS